MLVILSDPKLLWLLYYYLVFLCSPLDYKLHVLNPNIQDFAQIILNFYSAFHSIKTFNNLETATSGTENFQKLHKLLNFRNANHSTENSRNSGSKVEWKENFQEKKFFENFGITREDVLFSRNFGKCCCVHYWKLWKIQTRCFAWMESAPSFCHSYNEPSSYEIGSWTPPSQRNMKVHVCWLVNQGPLT